MYSKSDNISFTSDNDANEVVDELFESLHTLNLETSMRGSELIFDSVQLMYYKCHKQSFRRCGSYIDSPE